MLQKRRENRSTPKALKRGSMEKGRGLFRGEVTIKGEQKGSERKHTAASTQQARDTSAWVFKGRGELPCRGEVRTCRM